MTNWHDKSDVLKEVKSLGNYLFYASKKLRDDKEVVLTALKNNGQVFEVVSPRLQNDKEVIYAAAKKGYIPRR